METLTDRKIVRQSNSLNTAKFTLSALALDILHLLFAQIKQDDVEFKEFKMFFVEIEQKLGKQINSNYIHKVLNELRHADVVIQNDRSIDVYGFISSFSYSKEDGWLTLRIDNRLKDYLLNLRNNFVLSNYLEVSKLKGMYSKRIYTMFKQFETTGYLGIDLSKFTYQLDLEDKYKVYYDFKKRVLLPALKEINEKSDLNVSVNEVTVSKKVTKLEFFIKKAPTETKTVAPKIKKVRKVKEGVLFGESWLAKQQGREFSMETEDTILKSDVPSWMSKFKPVNQPKESASIVDCEVL